MQFRFATMLDIFLGEDPKDARDHYWLAEQTANESIADLNEFRDRRHFDEESRDCKIKANNTGKEKKGIRCKNETGDPWIRQIKLNPRGYGAEVDQSIAKWIQPQRKKKWATLRRSSKWHVHQFTTGKNKQINSEISTAKENGLMAAEGTCWGQKLTNQ